MTKDDADDTKNNELPVSSPAIASEQQEQQQETNSSSDCRLRRNGRKLKGLLELLQNQYKDYQLETYSYNKHILDETQRILKTTYRRRKRKIHNRRKNQTQHCSSNNQDEEEGIVAVVSEEGVVETTSTPTKSTTATKTLSSSLVDTTKNPTDTTNNATTSTTTTTTVTTPSYYGFEELCHRNKFVCFFFVQEPYTAHTLSLRHQLAYYYHDSITLFFVLLNETTDDNDNDIDLLPSSTSITSTVSSMFLGGTGCSKLPPSSLLLTFCSVTQIPAIVIVNTATGRTISRDAGLAIEWNTTTTVAPTTTSNGSIPDPSTKNEELLIHKNMKQEDDDETNTTTNLAVQTMLSEWEKGNSGLTLSQTILAVSTLQSNELSCHIL